MASKFSDWIIYEDAHILAVNKPSGISSLDERLGGAPSVLGLAREYDANAQLCHRIDKETSGVLLIAKDNDTYKECARLFRDREVEKTYLAIAEGRHQFNDLVVDLPLTTTARGKAKVDKQEGKPATTHFTNERSFGHFTLVLCRPVTGRLHQIRLHLASQNAVIAGDEAYGGQLPYLSALKRRFNMGRGREESPMISRTALHAHRLRFVLNDKKYDLVAPLPKDLSVFLKLLDKFDSL